MSESTSPRRPVAPSPRLPVSPSPRLPVAATKRTAHGLGAAASAVLGSADAARGGFRTPRFDPARVRRILVIRLDLLGDVINSLPAVYALRAAFPEARIDALVLPYAAPLLRRAVPELSGVLAVDINAFRRPRGWTRAARLAAALRQLRAAEYDLCLCLHGRVSSLLALLSGARWRVGYAGESYPGAMNLPVPGYRYHLPRHEAEYCLDLVRALDIAVEPNVPRLELPDDARTRADELMQTVGLGDSQRFVLGHPGSSNGQAKRWPAPLWARLADAMQQRLGPPLVLTGTAGEASLVAEIEAQAAVKPINLVGRTDLLTLAALSQRSAAVVSGDTGPLHLAAAAGAPVVGLFGPTDPTNYAPISERAAVLQYPVPCGPCYDLRTPADCKLPDKRLDCMWGLSVERVLQALEDVTSSGSAPPAARP